MKRKSAGSKIIAGLREFCEAFEKGEQLTVRTVELKLEPTQYNSRAVRQTRELLKMSQALFAQFLGVDQKTVQAWEQGTRQPMPIACRFMDEIRRDPEHWLERISKSITVRERDTSLDRRKCAV